MVGLFYKIFSNNKANYYRIYQLCYLSYGALNQTIYLDIYTRSGYFCITRTYKATHKRLYALKDLLTICESSQW